MTDAFIFDHLRSPRGRGKQGGALNAITPINLATQVLAGLRDRNELDTGILDDVILGCVSPVGEQGANVARVAAMNADYAETVPGKQINRFCSSGSKSSEAVPSLTEPMRLMTPALWSRCSAMVVFPDPACPASTTLRSFEISTCGTR